MRGQTLAIVRQRLKAELGDAIETNDAADEQYNLLLNAEQEMLSNQYEWNFLTHSWDLACPPGSRYLNFPTSDVRGLACSPSFENNITAKRFFNLKYWNIDYGVYEEHYNWRNSDLGQAIDPIQRWEVATNVNEDTNPNQVEIWPIPVTAQVIRFTGQRELKPFASDTDTCDLDDLLIVYSLAAKRLALREHKNAGLMQRQFENHLANLRQGYPGNTDPVVFGRRAEYQQAKLRRNAPVVVVSSG